MSVATLRQMTETAMSSDRPDAPKAVRERLGLDRSDMAELVGMSAFGYGQWEDGNRRPGGAAFRLLYLLQRGGSDAAEQLRGFPG